YGAHDAFFDDLRRQSVQRALERVARVDVFAVNPRFAILPVDVVAQQGLVHLVDVWVLGEHDVPGEVKGEAVHLKGAAPAPDGVVLFQQQSVLTQVVGGTQAGGTGAN